MGKTKTTLKFKVKNYNDLDALSFVSSGVACFAISLLDNLKLIDKILSCGFLNNKDINAFPNKLCLQAAITTLVNSEILRIERGRIFLTDFGYRLLQHRGSIGLIYDGYRHVLANQMKYALDESFESFMDIDGRAVSKASIFFGENTVDPLISEIILELGITGVICDLGCGACTRLMKICKQTGTHGLGIELCSQSVKLAKKTIGKNSKIKVQNGDITKIAGIYNNVELIMQFFVMHDIAPSNKCLRVINNYLKTFPCLKYFLYVDVVSPSEAISTQLPGFDFVHGLLGIKTRTYEETMDIFNKSNFFIEQEIPANSLPNTFIWVLRPKN